MLLLDEATSALDEDSQHVCIQRLTARMRELRGSMVTIAHRQTTYAHADCLLVLKDGELVESACSDAAEAAEATGGEPRVGSGGVSGGSVSGGSSAHEKLMARHGEYYELFTGKRRQDLAEERALGDAAKGERREGTPSTRVEEEEEAASI